MLALGFSKQNLTSTYLYPSQLLIAFIPGNDRRRSGSCRDASDIVPSISHQRCIGAEHFDGKRAHCIHTRKFYHIDHTPCNNDAAKNIENSSNLFSRSFIHALNSTHVLNPRLRRFLAGQSISCSSPGTWKRNLNLYALCRTTLIGFRWRRRHFARTLRPPLRRSSAILPSALDFLRHKKKINQYNTMNENGLL